MSEANTNYKSLILGLSALIFFGYLAYSMNTYRDSSIDRMKITPLDALAAVSGTGKLIRIEGLALGEPQWKSSNGEKLAFQKLRIIDGLGQYCPILFDGFTPPYFCLSNEKGSVYIDSSSLVEFQGLNSNSNRADIAMTMLSDFDKYLGTARSDHPLTTVWTIKNGAHVSAVGEIILDKDKSHYLLKAPSFWHAPLLGGQIWLSADNGIKTM